MKTHGEGDRNGEATKRAEQVAAEKREILRTLLIVSTKLKGLRRRPEFLTACDEVTRLLEREISRLG